MKLGVKRNFQAGTLKGFNISLFCKLLISSEKYTSHSIQKYTILIK